jgi:hypothetical protein
MFQENPSFFFVFSFFVFLFFLFKFFSGGLKYLKKNCVFQILLKFQYSLILMYFDTNFEYSYFIFKFMSINEYQNWYLDARVHSFIL